MVSCRRLPFLSGTFPQVAIKLLKLEPFMKFFWNFKQNSEEYIKKAARARCVVKISYMKLVFTNII